MQCKDIPDSLFLRAVEDTSPMSGTSSWRAQWEVQAALNKLWGREIPDRLFLAKAQKLIDRNWLAGCACGCRGDFFVTEAGKFLLEA